VHYVIIARAAASSTSACFAAHSLCLLLDAVCEWHGRRTSNGCAASAHKTPRTDALAADSLNLSVIDNLCRCAPAMADTCACIRACLAASRA
jgi:hypothetical protein